MVFRTYSGPCLCGHLSSGHPSFVDIFLEEKFCKIVICLSGVPTLICGQFPIPQGWSHESVRGDVKIQQPWPSVCHSQSPPAATEG